MERSPPPRRYGHTFALFLGWAEEEDELEGEVGRGIMPFASKISVGRHVPLSVSDSGKAILKKLFAHHMVDT